MAAPGLVGWIRASIRWRLCMCRGWSGRALEPIRRCGSTWHRRSACVEVCAGCPVRTSCLAGALARDEQCGVWGGLALSRRWVAGQIRPQKDRFAVRMRSPYGEYDTFYEQSQAKAERRLRWLLYAGRRRTFVMHLVRRTGRRVRMPGGWFVGPWTDPDSEQAVASMRTLLPASLRDRPVDRWPWELRLLFELPDDARRGVVAQSRSSRQTSKARRQGSGEHRWLDGLLSDDGSPVEWAAA